MYRLLKKRILFLNKCSIICVMLLSWSFTACGSENDNEEGKNELQFISTSLGNNTENILLDTQIAAIYNMNILLDENQSITVNGNKASVSVLTNKLIFNIDLEQNKKYEIKVPANAVKNEYGKNAPAVSFSFTTVADSKRYEAEEATLLNGAAIEKSISGFSGSGYVNQKDGDISFTVTVPETGPYSMNISYFSENQRKENDLYINNAKVANLTFEPAGKWSIFPLSKVILNKGSNTITIKKNWGWTYYDYIEIFPQGKETPFDIATNLVTNNASPQAVKLYDFLKENFGKKIISGSMELKEADWIFEKTGKQTALVGLDFMNYTRDWDWVDYAEIVSTSKNWWSNNGIVTIMWHWRDPSFTTDEFYTEKTAFDASNINNPDSEEYKAIIRDIDIVARYLKQLKEANIPVLWRPLHEASGKWFWWGAKGAEPCKKIWMLLYDRLTNYHGLNNLIWIWTSDSANDALEWYPGDDYVDIIGMDIYPGENQHGSQYISFNKVKELFGGKKLIALTECGSVPEIEKMFEYGDTWSWFMPWGGDYTRSDKHNGADYLSKIMQNSNVITREQMPDLK